jgi:DNA-binding response OmpR family regulator
MVHPRLLVVDDDEYTRSALATLFSWQGWQVSLASTVAEGLARLEVAPHCVILDLNLPDGGGESILREVRTKLPSTRVAVCSALGDARRIDAVAQLRPELLLSKPIDMAPLYRMCQEVAGASA